jgi:signal transduction histidine kinase
VRVSVRDTGVGLTPEEQTQLFARFFRARNAATREAGGTGLGLVITRSLVWAHGGTMSVTSQPGEGSTFEFTLPVASAEQDEGS